MRYDLAVIGGGINGCGIAADAAQRGLKVILIEKSDIAGGTSSHSSKLIHGGLRYLEMCDFSLVRKSLQERQLLLELASYLIHPQEFLIPKTAKSRPSWLVRLGLLLYDNLSASNQLSRSFSVSRKRTASYFKNVIPEINHGHLYYDAITDDARLTLVNALQAAANMAVICPRTALISAEADRQGWVLHTKSTNGVRQRIQARVVINACGPWVEKTNTLLRVNNNIKLSLVKGSHIVVPALYPGKHAFLLQHADKRIVFVVPYHGYSLVGTTDVAFKGNLDAVAIEPFEVNYLLEVVAEYFNTAPSKNSIIYSWSGIRPLITEANKSPQSISRDYYIKYNNVPAPSLTIYGGKITTYRTLAKEAVDILNSTFPSLKASSTAKTPLPGSNWGKLSFEQYQDYARSTYPWLNEAILQRLLTTYGCLCQNFLQDCVNITDLGRHFGHGLYEREVDYLVNQEWAISSEDILWRRTKLGFVFNQEMEQNLRLYLKHA